MEQNKFKIINNFTALDQVIPFQTQHRFLVEPRERFLISDYMYFVINIFSHLGNSTCFYYLQFLKS